MVFLENVIHILYFVMAGLIALSMFKSFFKRKANKGYVFDIMYAYCLIPFILRVLYIK
ncbi:MAG: hypothetical protein PHI83_09870 [Sphaerochaetaceae bacterium]|nr:hypothetical protein [Sphaerochaetaceae bacterium]